MSKLDPIQFTGQASASAALTTISATGLGALPFSAASSASAALNSITVTDIGPLAFAADASAAVTLTGLHILRAEFTAKASARVVLPRSYGLDITTGRPAYRLVILSSATGVVLGEIETANVGPATDVLNGVGSFSFSVAASDPKAALCQPIRSEVQLWRGGQVEWWGVIVRAREDGQRIELQAAGLLWYATRRTIGKFPRVNLLANGDFADGLTAWSFGWLPGSVPEAPPVHAISTDALTGSSSLSISGYAQSVTTVTRLSGDVSFEYNSATLTYAGESALDDLCAKITALDPTLTIEGHTDSTGTSGYNYTLGLARANSVKRYVLGKIPKAQVTTSSAGETQPIATNGTAAGRALNRRVEIGASYEQTARGNKQYASQSLTYTNPSAHRVAKLTLVGWYKVLSWVDPGIGYGAALESVAADGTLIAAANAQLDAATPVQTWTRQECSIDVEAGATVTVNVRLHPPSGTVVWDAVWLTEDTVTAWHGTDQASIVAGLVAHMQDPAMGKSDLRIGTRCPATGRRRDRTYAWAERRTVAEALDGFTTLADGMDIGVEWTPTARTLATYYPRKGSDTSYVLALGSNMIGYTRSVDGEQMATTVAVQASYGYGSGREEGVVQDATPLDGVVLESVYQAPSFSSVGTLDEQAATGWQRYSKASSLPQPIMGPSYTSELLTNVAVGDRVRVIIPGGLVPTDGQYRIIGQSLDPASDQITYTLSEE